MTRKIAPLIIGLLLASSIAFAACSGDDAPDKTADDTLIPPSEMNFDRPLVVYEATGDDAEIVDLYLLDPESGDRARLTQGDSFNAGPAWSPVGQRISFSSTRDGQEETDLYTMARDGTDVRRLTDTPDAEYEPRISPDGSSVVYVRQDDKDWILSIMDIDGGNRRDLTPPYKFAEFPAWRPDGSLIAFAGLPPNGRSTDIYVVSPAGGDVRPMIATATQQMCPHFTVDREKMLYASIREGEKQLDIYEHDMNDTDTTGANDKRLTDHPAKDDYGEPGPDGRIVFVTDRDGNPELYIMNADGSGQRRLTNTPDIRENLPDW